MRVQYPSQLTSSSLKNAEDIFSLPKRANIIAGNGIFSFSNNGFIATLSATNISHYQNDLPPLENKIYILKKIPIEIYSDVIHIFWKIKNLSIELLVDVYYSIENDNFILDVPVNQEVSRSLIKYDSNFNLITELKNIHVLQIHYHNNFKTNFSEKDDIDEAQKPFPCVFGILSKISEKTSVYDCNHNFRIWDNHNFIYLSLSDIFDIPIVSNKQYKEIDKNINVIVKNWEKRQKEEGLKYASAF